MRIVRVVDRFDTASLRGDLQPNYYHLSKLTARKGVEMHVVCGRKPGQPVEEEVESIRIHRVAPIANYRDIILGPFSRAVGEEVLRLDPDLVHGHQVFHWGCIHRRRRLRAPILSHYHAVTFSRMGAFLPFGVDPRRALYDRAMRWFYLAEAAAILNRSDHVVAVCRFQAAEIRRLVRTPVSVIHFGVDTGHFRPGPSRLKEELGAEHLLLYVGRPVPWKGGHLLLQALARLEREFPGLWTLFLGTERGDEDVYGRWLQGVAASLGLRRVLFRPPVPQSRLPDYYNAADALVVPFLPDSLGKVVLEGLACNTPVVAADAGGIREVWSPECGLLHRPGDAGDLAAKLAEALRRGRSAFGGRAMAERFTWSRSAEETLRLYERILE